MVTTTGKYKTIYTGKAKYRKLLIDRPSCDHLCIGDKVIYDIISRDGATYYADYNPSFESGQDIVGQVVKGGVESTGTSREYFLTAGLPTYCELKDIQNIRHLDCYNYVEREDSIDRDKAFKNKLDEFVTKGLELLDFWYDLDAASPIHNLGNFEGSSSRIRAYPFNECFEEITASMAAWLDCVEQIKHLRVPEQNSLTAETRCILCIERKEKEVTKKC